MTILGTNEIIVNKRLLAKCFDGPLPGSILKEKDKESVDMYCSTGRVVFTNVDGLRHENGHNFKTYVSRKICLKFIFTKGDLGKTFVIEYGLKFACVYVAITA